jgi:hypothetical protein
MAINILLIPSISAEAERIFLGGRQTIAWDRISLGSTNIECTECLKSWLRSNITDDRLVATDVVVEALDRGALMEQSTPTTPSQRSPD